MSGLRRWVRSGSPQGVAINSTATIHLGTGLDYHQLLLKYTSTIANMTEIRVIANGVSIMRLSAAQLNEINQYYGRASAGTDAQLFIDFDRRGVRTRSAGQISALGTGPHNAETNPRPITSLSVEVDLGAVASPALTLAALVSKGGPSGAVRKIRPFVHTPGGSGDHQISDFPQGDILLAAHLKSSQIVRFASK